jgi:hypothetical protein
LAHPRWPVRRTRSLGRLDRVLDRSHLLPPGTVESVLQGMQAGDAPDV